MIAADTRAALAQQQEGLLRALTSDAPGPEGFDGERVRAAGRALLFKRRRALARAWPRLAASLDGRFGELFAEFAAATPLAAEGSPLADGYSFAAWVAERGELTDDARLERLGVLLHHVPAADGLAPRRWPFFTWEWLPASRRLVLALSWPGGQWVFRLP